MTLIADPIPCDQGCGQMLLGLEGCGTTCPDCIVKEPTPENVERAMEIALSYVPINDADLYHGCIGPWQCHDAAQRIAAQFAAEGWTVTRAST